ncbi:MAG TPA: hydrogenase nickel incorporation protein HypA [Opitutaceae bacterium]|nr:hydrogenase nickel incorporation protein HypA [Opitutaceae bacterium]
MFSTDITIALVLAVAGGIALLVGLWVYYDRRDRRLYDGTRRKTTFHCLKCGHVYTSAERHELCACPRCGHENPRLHF